MVKVLYQSEEGTLFTARAEAEQADKALGSELELYNKTGLWSLVTSRDRKWGFDGIEWIAINRASGHMSKPWQRGTIPGVNALARCREFMGLKSYILRGNYPEVEQELSNLGLKVDLIKAAKEV